MRPQALSEIAGPSHRLFRLLLALQVDSFVSASCHVKQVAGDTLCGNRRRCLPTSDCDVAGSDAMVTSAQATD